MGANQSMPRWKRSESHTSNPGPTSGNRVHGSAIENNNGNLSQASGSARIANNNSNMNVQDSPGVSLYYAPVTYFNTPASKEPDGIQTRIATALKERHVPTAVYTAQSEKGCMTGTRVQVLRDIENWILSPKAKRIFWLTGKAGMGKTAIAHTVCTIAHANKQIMLGGSFFCSRSTGLAAQRDVRCIVPTLAQLLARQSTGFSKALAAELKRDPDILYQQVTEQVEHLLYIPLLAVKKSLVPILFVIDALDECSDRPTSEMASNGESHRIVSDMLEALVNLSNSSVKLPVRFLVTSRPETHIRDTPVSDVAFSSVLQLHTVNKQQVTADIHLYVSRRLFSFPKLRACFTADDVEMLVHLSDGLFIVATTALKYVLDGGIEAAASRFKTLLNSTRDGLSSGAAAPLDHMYGLILADATKVDQIDGDELQAMPQLLASLLSARMTLSVAALADLHGTDRNEVRARLSDLHAVIHVPDNDNEPGLRTLHASFGDYLMSRRPRDTCISGSLGHKMLARGCLRIMAERLHFNMSQSRSSYEPNPKMRPDAISLSLEYACLQWIHHVAAISDSSEFDEEIDGVFRSRFLFWLEVVSLLGNVSRAAAILFFAASTVCLPELSKFFRDANAFVTSSHEAIERSASHIYLSALPFAAKESLVYKTFYPLCAGLIHVETFGIDRHRGRMIMALAGHGDAVTSIAYSPDGFTIASGSYDGTVRIWNTRTGEETMSPLCSGDGRVRSVAFAPNGQRLATGNNGVDVCVWSLQSNDKSLRRLCGHSGSVLSVVFSPDGAVLASASKDKTVRLWSPDTGHRIAILVGHAAAVKTVAFSQDGACLASGSSDETIRLWHVTTRKPAGRPLQVGCVVLSICFSPDGTVLGLGCKEECIQLWDLQSRTFRSTLSGHTDWIRSLNFSPDGQSLISGSDDCTIRFWTVSHDTGKASSVVVADHIGYVYTAVFSPDGLYFASASGDDKIRIWDTGSARQAVQPLLAYEDCINSVAVAPCGYYIVSGSNDRSVYSWDLQTGEARSAPLLGHTERVYSVTISPNGRLIASASQDGIVRLWDTRTGDGVCDPLRYHKDAVNTVIFSPDSRWLASGADDCTVHVWDTATGRPSDIAPLRCEGQVLTLAFSPDGISLAAGDSTGRIHFWRADTGQRLCEPLQANDQIIRSIGFSPDGARIVAGGYDKIVRLWDCSTREQLLSLRGHSKWVFSVAVSPNGELICSGSLDHTVCLWKESNGALISVLCGHAAWVRSVAFTPDGRYIVSGSVDRTIRVWDMSADYTLRSNRARDPISALASATFKGQWLVGSSDELLLWVPADYREHLQIRIPPCPLRIGKHLVTVTGGSDGWYSGKSWTSCWRKDSATHTI